MLYYARIQQGGSIAQAGCFSFSYFAQYSSHDLARTGFGKPGNELDLVRFSYRADDPETVCAISRRVRSASLIS